MKHTIQTNNNTMMMAVCEIYFLSAKKMVISDSIRKTRVILMSIRGTVKSWLWLLNVCPFDQILAISVLILGIISFSHSPKTWMSPVYFVYSNGMKVFPYLLITHTNLLLFGSGIDRAPKMAFFLFLMLSWGVKLFILEIIEMLSLII